MKPFLLTARTQMSRPRLPPTHTTMIQYQITRSAASTNQPSQATEGEATRIGLLSRRQRASPSINAGRGYSRHPPSLQRLPCPKPSNVGSAARPRWDGVKSAKGGDAKAASEGRRSGQEPDMSPRNAPTASRTPKARQRRAVTRSQARDPRKQSSERPECGSPFGPNPPSSVMAITVLRRLPPRRRPHQSQITRS